MNESGISDLLALLDREMECCTKLIEISRIEQRCIVEDDLEKLNRCTREMRKKVMDLRQLHEKRNSLLKELVKIINPGSKDASLYSIICRLEEGPAEFVKERVRRLIKTGTLLYKLNQKTIYLINYSLGLVDKQVEMWSSALGQGDGRSEGGETPERRGRGTRIIHGKA